MRTTSLVLVLICSVMTGMAQPSPHGTIRIPCSSCHTTDSWRMRPDAQFDHVSTGFDLIGVHKSVDCGGCHRGLVFAGTKSSCQSCHTDVHKGELGNSCVRCHSFQSWRITDMIQRHQQTRFPLVGNHAAADCRSCHTKSAGNQYLGTPTTCIGCHRTQYDQTTNPSHRAAGFSIECTDCHRMNAVAWGTGFDHAATRFPLIGAHRATSCSSCHRGGNFKATVGECAACHADEYQRTTNPAHAAAGFSVQCANCHEPTAWGSGRYDHAATAFPLTGAHMQTQCRQCHGDNLFKGRSADCYVCHQTDYAETTVPAHLIGGFPHQCVMCHTTSGWRPSLFTHDNTRFPLQGAHRSVVCSQCHVNNVYTGTSKNCIDCHHTDFNGAVNPNHVAGNFSTLCTTCHTMNGWKPASFDHTTTRFALTGAHITVQCASCHVNGNYQLVYSDCYQCHQANYAAVLNPNHAAAGFAHTCDQCHTTTAWKPSTFSHATTNFPLQGAHLATTCSQCHTNGRFAGTPTACIDCHRTDFNGAVNPNHVAGNFSTLCTTCHTMNGWKPASFDHTTTRFALTGAHITVQCASCHMNGNYQLVYSDCYQCHQTNYAAVLNPNHAAAGFAHTCNQCHTTTAWKPSTFSHATTNFPLQGAHLATTCSQCHTNGRFAGTPTACIDCHRTDFNGAVNPNHVAGNFSTLCTTCHTMNGWKPASFDHTTTRFALTGAHTTVQCASCHVNGNYQLVYSDCYQCHQANYVAVVNPNHAAAGFAHTCEQCHTTTAWKPSTFSHSTTKFVLQGAHQAVACDQCHPNGRFAGTPTACIDCHRTDFNAVATPNHVSGGFSTLCTTCHSMNAWKPATFDHGTTRLPLTGRHAATACQDCHVGGNYQLTYQNCVQCHLTNYQNASNPRHTGAAFNQQCEACHSTNGWSPAAFTNHGLTPFPLTGAHVSAQCAACHANNNYQLVYTDCYACHQTAYAKPTMPNHVVANFAHACEPCHTTTAWKPWTVNHDAKYMNIYSGRHLNRWGTDCTRCHTPTNYSLFTCSGSGCHSQSEMDKEHSGVSGYSFSAPVCYNCHRFGTEKRI